MPVMMILQASEGPHHEDMSVGLATKWESLCLVPERSVEGLVTRRWDKANVRKPNMNIKKGKYKTLKSLSLGW